jgi:hypothetical protein
VSFAGAPRLALRTAKAAVCGAAAGAEQAKSVSSLRAAVGATQTEPKQQRRALGAAGKEPATLTSEPPDAKTRPGVSTEATAGGVTSN